MKTKNRLFALGLAVCMAVVLFGVLGAAAPVPARAAGPDIGLYGYGGGGGGGGAGEFQLTGFQGLPGNGGAGGAQSGPEGYAGGNGGRGGMASDLGGIDPAKGGAGGSAGSIGGAGADGAIGGSPYYIGWGNTNINAPEKNRFEGGAQFGMITLVGGNGGGGGNAAEDPSNFGMSGGQGGHVSLNLGAAEAWADSITLKGGARGADGITGATSSIGGPGGQAFLQAATLHCPSITVQPAVSYIAGGLSVNDVGLRVGTLEVDANTVINGGDSQVVNGAAQLQIATMNLRPGSIFTLNGGVLQVGVLNRYYGSDMTNNGSLQVTTTNYIPVVMNLSPGQTTLPRGGGSLSVGLGGGYFTKPGVALKVGLFDGTTLLTSAAATAFDDNGATATLTVPGLPAGSTGRALVLRASTDGGATWPDRPEETLTQTGAVPVTGVAISPKTMDAVVGDTVDFTATVAPPAATGKGVSWSTTMPGANALAPNGLTARLSCTAAGTYTVTVTTTEGGFTDTATVKVVPREVTGIALDKTEISLYAGQTDSLAATLTPANATNQTVAWAWAYDGEWYTANGLPTPESDGDGPLVLTPNGLQLGFAAGSAGHYVITARAGGHTAQCKVTVMGADVRVTPAQATVAVGGTVQLAGQVTPVPGGAAGGTWRSDDTGIATVDGNGLVTGKAVGSVLIYLEANDGSARAQCAVTVVAATSSSATSSSAAGGTNAAAQSPQTGDMGPATTFNVLAIVAALGLGGFAAIKRREMEGRR